VIDTLAALLMVVPLVAPSVAFNCDAVSFGSVPQTHTAIHSDVGEKSSIFQYLQIDRDRCTQVVIVGKVTYTDAEDDIASMSETAHAYFRERTPTIDRGLVVRRTDGGTIDHVYRINGAPAPYDDVARRWLGVLLPAILREAAINVGPRVAHWRAEGGVDRVLEMIGTMKSPSAMKSHYDVLIDSGRLSRDEADRVMRHASRDLRGSSDLRSVLSKLAPFARPPASF
jgi:hypothetical protein